MTLIKLAKDKIMAGPDGVSIGGDVVDVHPDIAAQLIAEGAAELAEQRAEPVVEPVVEVADVASVGTWTKADGRPKRR